MLTNLNYIPPGIKPCAHTGTNATTCDHIYTCPMCGGDNLHPDALCVDNIRIPLGPESLVQIGFWCEVCGQIHTLTVSHHEGQTFVTTRPHRPTLGACHGA